MLDPVKDLNIGDLEFKELLRKIDVLELELKESPLSKPENKERLEHLYTAFSDKMELINRVKSLKKEIKKKTEIMQLEELKQRKRVLRR